MKKWFTIYFDFGQKKIGRFLANRDGKPIGVSAELARMTSFSEGFDFSQVFNTAENTWKKIGKTPDSTTFVKISDLLPLHFTAAKLEKYLSMYDIGQLGYRDLEIQSVDHVWLARLPFRQLPKFWERVLQREGLY